MSALFSFGTLMDEELLTLVSGQSIESLVREPAIVQNHAAFWVVDDHYPMLVPMNNATTTGIIIRGLQAEALERIIFFEGGEFTVNKIEVSCHNGSKEIVSFFADNNVKSVSNTRWSLAEWQRTTKPDTMPRVDRYMQCFGKMDVHEADAFW